MAKAAALQFQPGSDVQPPCTLAPRPSSPRPQLENALGQARAVVAGLEQALGVLEAPPANLTEIDRLVDAEDRLFDLTPTTFRRWIREGRLKAFQAERGRYVAWESDVRRAIEAEPYEPNQTAAGAAPDPMDEAIASGRLRTGPPRRGPAT